MLICGCGGSGRVLRLLNHRCMLEELQACTADKLNTLQSLTFHRVIDNETLTMSANDVP